MNEENMAVDTPVTPAETVETPVNESPVVNTESVKTPAEKMYTKGQIVELMKKRVARTHNSFYSRYGVENLQGLDELFEKSKKFQSMQDEYGAIQLKNSDLVRENAFLRNNINPDKYNDIVAYFKGTGQDFTEELLLSSLSTHPEWLKPSNVPAQTTIERIGSEVHNKPEINEKEQAFRLLGVRS